MENEIPSVKAAAPKMTIVLCLALLLATAGLAGCNLLPELSFPSQEENPTATTVPGEVTPSVSPTPSLSSTISSAITLTLWTTEAFFPTEDNDSGQVLAQQWQAFQAAHPNVTNRIVRTIGKPAERFAEDYLRILRFFRFHAWYGDPEGGLDPEALAAIFELSAGLETLSRERVGGELTKLLAAPDPAPSVARSTTSRVTRSLPG